MPHSSQGIPNQCIKFFVESKVKDRQQILIKVGDSKRPDVNVNCNQIKTYWFYDYNDYIALCDFGSNVFEKFRDKYPRLIKHMRMMSNYGFEHIYELCIITN